MVSIRYFCGVGEFCSVKSKPCDGATWKTGAARTVANVAKTKTQHARSKIFTRPVPQEASITRERHSCSFCSRVRRIAKADRQVLQSPLSRSALDKCRWNQYFFRLNRPFGRDARQQEFSRESSNTARALINCGERDRQHVRVMNIAGADHTNIIGQSETGFQNRLHRANGDGVVVTEHRVGPGTQLQKIQHALVSALISMPSRHNKI